MVKRRQSAGELERLDTNGPGVLLPLNLPSPYDAVYGSIGEWMDARLGSEREEVAMEREEDRAAVKPAKLSLADEVSTIHEKHSFYPVNRVEVSQAMGLQHELGKRTSTVLFLNDKLRRQAKPGTNIIRPDRTPLNAVREFANHACDARLTRIVLKDLLARTDGINPNLKMDTLTDEISPESMIPVLRNHKIWKAVKTARFIPEQFEDMGAALDFDYMAAPLEGAFEKEIMDLSSRMTVMGTRIAAERIDLQQAYRTQFWDARIIEANGHFPSRPAVKIVLGVAAPRGYYPDPINPLSQ